MTDPLHIRVERPYKSAEDFLAAEAWSVAARSLLLINVDAVPPGTALRCELCLSNGQVLVMAEGTAVKYAEATPTRPAGLVVRYKRMSSASSDFVRLAVARAAETRTASSPTATEGPLSSRASHPPSNSRSRASIPAPRPSSRAPSAAPRLSSRAPGRRSERPSESKPLPKAPGRRSERPSESKPLPKAPGRRSERPSESKPPGRRSERPSESTSGFQSQQTSGRADAQSRRSSRPAGREGAQRSPKAPSERKLAAVSWGPGKDDGAGPSRGVSPPPTRDNAAMQRLRTRTLSRVISSPPDRETVLARLKKKSERK